MVVLVDLALDHVSPDTVSAAAAHPLA
jgi:hypothetical protein